MNEQPFFSVGVPTFNRARFLGEALSGMLSQSCQDFELVVADNCSTDDTEAIVRSISDPRIRYYRHERNIGPIPNFAFVARQARGEFVVFHQDDDLLHRDFLKRCQEAVAAKPEVVLYASPWWRGNAKRGFTSKLFRDAIAGDPGFVIQDRPLVLDGRIGAVSLLHSFHFCLPTVAFRRSALEKAGGYHSEVANVSDVITEGRVLCQGSLVYDPRIGGIFTDHGENASRTMDKAFKILTYRNMYHGLVRTLEENGVEWKALLEADLKLYSDNELLAVFSDWARYGAPRRLQEVGWRCLSTRRSLVGMRKWRKLLSKVGVRNLVRFKRSSD